MNILNKKKMWVKVVALTLVQSFLGWNAASAAVSDRSMWQQRGKVSQIGTSVSSNALAQETLEKGLFAEYFVPENSGTINEFWVPKGMDKKALSSSKLLIHVRDAHCNYEAQGNIANIINNFVKSNSLSFVSVEGTEGTIDYSLLNAFPDYEVRGKVSDAFMKLGRLSGAEYANINTKQGFDLFGAEDMAVYNSNLNNFRKTLSYKKEGVEFVSQIKDALETLKANMYTPELKELEEMSSLYNNREISFVDYCQYLYNLPAASKVRSGYKNFALLMEAVRVQDLIDFSQIDSEKTDLVNELARSVVREELSTLSQATIDFRRGKLSTAKYYQMLENLAQDADLDMAAYKNLRPYMVYLNVYEQIDSAELFQEKETLEAEVKRGLFKNLDQARLDKLSKNAEILEKIFSVRLTNADLAYFQDFRTDFTAWEFKSFIQEQAPKYNLTFNIDYAKDPIDVYLPKLEAFYMEAKTRDNILVENAMAQMDLEGKNVGVLVSGGFHTAGITSYARSRNIPYMVVTPRILREDVNNPYLNLIGGELLPVEKILEGDFQFSLSVPINAGQTTDSIGIAQASDPAASPDLTEGWITLAQANGLFANGAIPTRGTIANIPVVYSGSEADGYVVVTSTNNQAALITALDSASVQYGETATFADASATPASGALKGIVSNASKTALAKQDANVVADSIEALIKGKGSLAEFLTAVDAAAKAFPIPQAGKDGIGAIEVRSAKNVADYPYPSIPQPENDQALVDQHEVVISNGKVVTGGLTVALAAARATLNDSNAIKLLAGKLAHDAYELDLISKAPADADPQEVADAAHAKAVADVDDVVLRDLGITGVDNLAALGSFLDGSPSNEAFVAANATLATAADAFSKDPSEANAVKVFFAEVALRSVATDTSVKDILAQEDPAIIAQALAIAAPTGVAGLSAARNLLITEAVAPAIGQTVSGIEVPAEAFEILEEKGGVSLVISADIAGSAARAAIYTAALTEGADAVEALTEVDGKPVTVSSYTSGDAKILVVEAKIDDENAKAVAGLKLQYDAVAAAAAQADADGFIVINTSDATNAESIAAVVIGATTVTRGTTTIKIALQAGENKIEIRNQLLAAGVTAEQIVEEEVISDDARRVHITSKPEEVTTSDRVSVLKVEPASGKNAVRYDAALPLAALMVTSTSAADLANVRGLVVSLLGQMGITAAEQVESFLKNPFNGALSLPAQPLNINLLSIKLAIAA